MPPRIPDGLYGFMAFEMKPSHQSIACWRLIRDMTRGQSNLIEVQAKFSLLLVLAFFKVHSEIKTLIHF